MLFPLLDKNIWMGSKMEKQLLFKTKEIIYKTSLVILLGMFLYVLRYAFFDYRSMPFLDGQTSMWQKGVFMGGGVILLIQLILLLNKWMEQVSDQTCKVFIVFLFALLFLGQFTFLYTMKIQLRYDALKVLDEAVSLCKTGSVSPVHFDGYFARYTNNYPILLLTGFFLKVGRMLGIVDYDYQGTVFFLGLVNMVAIDVAVFISVKFVQRLKGMKGALLFALCICLNPLFIIWVPFYYTNTLAMPFIVLILYIFYLVFIEKNCDRKVSRIVGSLMLGVCIVTGIKIRATTVLTIVACVLYYLLADQGGKDKEDKKKFLKEDFIKGCWLIIGMLAALLVYKGVEVRFVSFDYADSAFPTIQWINMGAGGTGEYNILDEQMTMSYMTAEEKSVANWESYLARVKEHGITGYVHLMFQKLKLTFGDAGAGYRSELGVSDAYNGANIYWVGGKADFVGYVIQLQYVFCLVCILYALMKLFFDKKKCSNYEVVIFWNIAGAFVFHMIWEAGNIYSISFVILFPIAIVFAKDLFSPTDCVTKNIKTSWVCGSVGGVVIVSTLFTMISLYPDFVKQPYETNDAVVNQYIYHWGDEDELQMGEELLQSFYGNREFNRIAFQVRNLLGQENDGTYQIQLLNEKMESLKDFEICAKDYGDYDFVRLESDTISGEGQKYFLKVSKKLGSETGNLVFLSYHTGNYDAYSYGELVGGKKFQDLCFSVYMTKNEPYCGIVLFGLVLGIILLVEVCIQIMYYSFLKGVFGGEEDVRNLNE